MAERTGIEGIDAGTSFAEAAALAVETRSRELLERTGGVLDTTEIRNLHRMRVATRRLRAALEVFAPCFPAGQHKAALKEVKAIAGALGERRDRDVAIETLAGFSDSLPRPDRPGIGSLAAEFRAEQESINERLAGVVEPGRLANLDEQLRGLVKAARDASGRLETGS